MSTSRRGHRVRLREERAVVAVAAEGGVWTRIAKRMGLCVAIIETAD